MLKGMTQERWSRMTLEQREAARDDSALSKQLIGLEGWRVEVIDEGGNKWRFIVGKSTGWRPCHLEVSRRNALGGFPARDRYASVRTLYRARGEHGPY
jgi:hypothetical protein